ncbi:cutinase-domain-containing protein [Plectosphaerella plurivora]|uniref:Cutinase n=1 Tax=Plectosphaerella plurivora TaxID=936078 RepID=A0A9P9A4Z8_9PEZI|nr:cutinase-domain-containing protein [Plectosphaerella plurivora]
MHIFTALSFAVGMAVALPAGQAPDSTIAARQFSRGATRNDLEDGGTCPKVIFVYARATGEAGNLGVLGGPIGSALESEYGAGNVWVQGVGGPYNAGVAGNMQADGAPPDAINEMVRLLGKASEDCPEATIVAGGYSQGSALAAAAVRDSSSDVKPKIAGVVLFGYTKNQQNDGGIPDFPTDRVKVFCNQGDAVCNGSLMVTFAHLRYQSSARGPAAEYLVSMINGAGGAGAA